MAVALSFAISTAPISPKTVQAEESEPPSTAVSWETQAPTLAVPVIGKSLEDADLEAKNAVKPQKQAIRAQNAPKRAITPKAVDPSPLKEFARQLVTETWDGSQWAAFETVINNESGWNPNAVNASSGACGLPQALPCSKIRDKSPEGQVRWAVDYMKDRYGTPKQALAFWNSHHWY